jgi:GrpB-like predicted nucleotidyltransferase (UPF0157 family)
MKIILEEHNPQWALDFQQAHLELSQILAHIPPLAIYHVGSTCIPSLIAKPVLDIDIVVSAPAFSATRAALVAAGYQDRGEMGIPGRVGFHKPGYGRKDWVPENGIRRNTYVILENSLSLRNHLDLKRMLLSNEALRDEYAGVKRRLVEREFDGKKPESEYCKNKTGILLKI